MKTVLIMKEIDVVQLIIFLTKRTHETQLFNNNKIISISEKYKIKMKKHKNITDEMCIGNTLKR